MPVDPPVPPVVLPPVVPPEEPLDDVLPGPPVGPPDPAESEPGRWPIWPVQAASERTAPSVGAAWCFPSQKGIFMGWSTPEVEASGRLDHKTCRNYKVAGRV